MPDTVALYVDSAWYNGTDDKPDNPTLKERNSFAILNIINPKNMKSGEEALAKYLRLFEGWAFDDFNQLNPEIRKSIRHTLRKKGIYTGSFRTRIDHQLFGIPNMKEM